MTLGFKIKRNYDKTQLASLVSILPSILRHKGTVKAVSMAAEALIKSSGATGDFGIAVDGAQLSVTLPKELVDVTLFMDLLDYILPAGMTYRVIRNTQTKRYLDDILIGQSDTIHVEQHADLDWSSDYQSIGLSGLLDSEKTSMREFAANFILDEAGHKVLNTGLLSNTVIPVLSTDEPLISDEERRYINLFDKDGNILVSADNKILLAKE
jgi:hypothetical protein